MKSFKKVLSLILSLVCFVAVFCATGCGGGGDNSSTASVDWGNVDTQKTVKLKFTHIWSEHEETLDKICRNFEDLHPNVEIAISMKTYSNIDSSITSSWGSSQFPDVCFYWVQSASVLVNEDVQMAEDITDVYYELYKDDMIGDGASMSTGAVNGRTYIAPFRATGFVIYYNADMFEELQLEVPKTIEELEYAMSVIKEKKEGITPLSCWGSTGTYSYLPAALASYMDILSGKATDPNYDCGRLEMEDADFERSALCYEKVRKWTKAGYFGSNPLAGNTESVESEFLNEGCAMAILNNNSLAAIQSSMDAKVGCFAIPGFSTMDNAQAGYVSGGYDGFFISKNSKNKEWALEFLKYLFSEEAQQLFADEEGSVMARKNINYTDELQKEVAHSMENVGLLGAHSDYSLSTTATASSIALISYMQNSKNNGTVAAAKELVKQVYEDHKKSILDEMLNYPPLTMYKPSYTLNNTTLKPYLEWLQK